MCYVRTCSQFVIHKNEGHCELDQRCFLLLLFCTVSNPEIPTQIFVCRRGRQISPTLTFISLEEHTEELYEGNLPPEGGGGKFYRL